MNVALEQNWEELNLTEENRINLRFLALSSNEALARTMAAAFLAELDPTLEEVADVKTAVSEAVTNAIIHGYGIGELDTAKEAGKKNAWIHMECVIRENEFEVTVTDCGCGIPDVNQAMCPLYTSRPELERSGMGFSFMEAFMDEIQVTSSLGEGTTVWMKKKIGNDDRIEEE